MRNFRKIWPYYESGCLECLLQIFVAGTPMRNNVTTSACSSVIREEEEKTW